MTLKKYLVVLLLLALLSTFLSATVADTEVPPLPTQLTEQEKVLRDNTLTFLTDVFKIDLSRYSMTQVTSMPAPVPNGTILTFKFSSVEGKLDVSSEFSNGDLIWCKLYPANVPPQFTTQATSDVINTAKDTLDRINSFSAKDYLPTMRNMLSTAIEVKNYNVTIDDFTQNIVISGNIVKMTWEPYANGLSHPQYKLYLAFQDGYLTQYANYLDIYKIGNSEIKITEDQAIQMAKDRIHSFSYIQNGVTVSNFTILETLPPHVEAGLDVRGDYTLYPHYSLIIPLDRMYPGGVTYFRVMMWADTGEITRFSPMGSYGAIDLNATSAVEPQPTITPTAKATETNQDATLDGFIAVGMLVAATAIIAGYLLYKRKR